MKTDSTLMNLLPRLLEVLRHELQQYGEMLALLDQQQASVMARSADDVLSSVTAVNEQMGRIQAARQSRESCQAEIAAAVKLTEAPTFQRLIPLLPETYRAAVGALVTENNNLLVRVQQRARQNHRLLCQSVEMMQQFISSLVPTTPPVTYNETGQVQSPGAVAQSLYQAVG